MAKQALHLLGSQNASPVFSPLSGVRWTLLISGSPVSPGPCPPLLYHLSSHSAIPYWVQKGLISTSAANLVDWQLLGLALQSHPPTFCMWASKFASGHSAVASKMFLWKKWDSPLCPMCHLVEESTLHVLQCPHPDQTMAWHKAVDSLRQWLVNANTDLHITCGIISFLHARGLGSLAYSAHSSCQLAASDQDKIGFFGLLLGCLSPHWSSIQTSFWASKGCSRSV